ncbi:MAG TPA: hypothetical protein VMF89_36570, partial [Polyangiales bacterium]|nr:hypothetical protein [Polyangiales bacterium]
MTRARRIVKPLLIALLALAALIACAGLVIAYTASGRRFVADRIASAVTGEIPGRMEIGEITQLSWLWLRAKDVRFFHPDGRLVLHVENAVVEPDLLDALQAKLSFHRVAAEGGSMLFSSDPDGRLSFEAAMDSPYRPGMPKDPKRGLHYDMRNMHVEKFKLRFPTAGFENLQVSNVRGVVHVWRLDSVGTRVRLTDVSGSVAPEIAGQKLAIKDLDLLITGAEAVVAQGKARLSIDRDSLLSIQVRYAPKHKEKLQVNVLDKEGTEATTLTWLLHAAASFSKDIKVD